MLSLKFTFLGLFCSMCHKANAAPNDPPASPAAGCIQIFLKIFSLNNFPLATQFKATPPAKHKLSIPYSFFKDLANLISHETGCNENPIYVDPRPREIKEATCSADKARNLLGYKTKTSLKQAINLTTQFIKKRGVKEFEYHLPIEINNKFTPETWTKKKI